MTIYEAIAEIMKQGYSIGKDRKNLQQGFKYRGIDDVMNVFQPLMAEHGIFVVPEVVEQTREERQTAKGGTLIYSILKMRYTFYSSDGTSVSATVVGEGMDSGDKASNKAMAVAMKYAMFQVFCIPTEEMGSDDPDRTTPETSEPKKPAAPKFICEKCGKEIAPMKDKNGNNVNLRAYESRSREKFGALLCMECANAANGN